MNADAPKLLWDARDAAERIRRFTAGKSFVDYQGDELLRSAVERQFEIVGEALGRLRAIDPEVAKDIPDLPRIVAFRNVLIHGYASVDDRVVWGVVESQLETLIEALDRFLTSAN